MNQKCNLLLSMSLLALSLAACAEELAVAPAPAVEPGQGRVTFTREGAVTLATVDATAEDAMVYVDLDRDAEVAQRAQGWDLAFQRFQIVTNGGVSGDGDVIVAWSDAQPFDTIAQAPTAGYVVDAPDGDDDDALPDLALGAWYDYNPADHTLSAKARVYLLRTAQGGWRKLQIERYYDDAGTPAILTLRWAAVAAPNGEPQLDQDFDPDPDPNNATNNGANNGPEPDPLPEGAISVDASRAGRWIGLDLATGASRELQTPEEDATWDLAFSRTEVRTNSGTSGPGLGGAKFIAGGDFDATAAANTMGYAEDTLITMESAHGAREVSGNPALAQWYDYNPMTHAVTPRGGLFIVRTAAGEIAALKIHRYVSGIFTISVKPLALEVTRERLTVPTASGVWTRVNLRDGRVLAEGEGGDLDWDIALQRTQIQTNSGTSGPGLGGALLTDAAALEDLLAIPDGDLLEDAMLPLPGPPGAGEFSGNPALNDWYDYDPATHTVTPKARVYVVRTADGHYARLQVDAYEGGAWTFSWSYAGAGRDRFTP
jgi:hypothetical protein